jgi:hypothetical protein
LTLVPLDYPILDGVVNPAYAISFHSDIFGPTFMRASAGLRAEANRPILAISPSRYACLAAAMSTSRRFSTALASEREQELCVGEHQNRYVAS